MAINLNTTYPGQVEAPDANYPTGGAKNETAPSAFDGTPFEKAMANDVFGAQQFLLSKAGITASGSSETALISQYFNATRMLIGEVRLALASARIVFNTTNTIDIIFPYVFSDGSTWASITGFSTVTTGKTLSNIYWLGIFYDGSKTYTQASPPVAGDLTAVWSVSNVTEPVRPTDGIKFGTDARGVGDAGGDVDISNFWQFGKKYHHLVVVGIGVDTTSTITNFSIANVAPLNAVGVFGQDQALNASATGETTISSNYYTPADIVIVSLQLSAAENVVNDLGFRMWVDIPIFIAQTVRNRGQSIVATNLTSHDLLIGGFEE